jgi:hypothetical protein
MLSPSRRRTVTLRDGARATLRPIAAEDGPLLAAAFERLSEESRYRRFFTRKSVLSPTELAYFVDVDHKDHEAIIAIDPSSGEALGVARYIRLGDDAEVAEVAVTVVRRLAAARSGPCAARPPDVSGAARGRAPVQRVRLIAPWRRVWPVLSSDGTSPTEAHHVPGAREALPVADLGAQPDR